MKDMGELHYCLGVSIVQDRESESIWLHQKQYILWLLDRYGLQDAKMLQLLIQAWNWGRLSQIRCRSSYLSIKGQHTKERLLYAAMATRPDIAHAVGAASKFSANPTKTYKTAVKRTFQYLKLTMDYALRYKKSDLQLVKIFRCWLGRKYRRSPFYERKPFSSW